MVENYIPPRVQTGAPTGRVFVSANRSARYKNVSRMEAAFIRVKGSHPDVELDMRILPHQEQLERLASAYAAIIPSISEIGSNIAIESVVRGRPFITTEDTGTKERLGECGIFIDTRSDVAIERAIESLLDPDTYARYAAKAAAFSFVRNWDDIASDIVRVAHKV